MTVVAAYTAVVTAYCGYSGHLTAAGTVPRYGTIAADRSVPFGTTLDIPGYGVGTVLDRGGAIWGNRLDIYLPACRDAWTWGRRWLEVERLAWVPLPSPELEAPPLEEDEA